MKNDLKLEIQKIKLNEEISEEFEVNGEGCWDDCRSVTSWVTSDMGCGKIRYDAWISPLM